MQISSASLSLQKKLFKAGYLGADGQIKHAEKYFFQCRQQQRNQQQKYRTTVPRSKKTEGQKIELRKTKANTV